MAIGRINATLSGVQPGGLAKIVPTSVAVGSGSGSVDANGNVTFSGASSLSLNNVFSNTYTNYKINIRITGSATATLNLKFRENTTDKSTGYYGGCHYVSYVNTSGVAYFSNNGTLCGLVQNDSNGAFVSFDLQRNSGGAFVGFNGTGWSAQNGQGHYFGYYNIGGTNFDGFSLLPASGTISGTILISGYSQ